jgi:hypothetical protein
VNLRLRIKIKDRTSGPKILGLGLGFGDGTSLLALGPAVSISRNCSVGSLRAGVRWMAGRLV